MATDPSLNLEYGDLARIAKLTMLHKLGPDGKGFSRDYVRQCLDLNDERSNAEITAIAKGLVAARQKTMKAMALLPRTKHRLRK